MLSHNNLSKIQHPSKPNSHNYLLLLRPASLTSPCHLTVASLNLTPASPFPHIILKLHLQNQHQSPTPPATYCRSHWHLSFLHHLIMISPVPASVPSSHNYLLLLSPASPFPHIILKLHLQTQHQFPL
jgi:hypothetical protein